MGWTPFNAWAVVSTTRALGLISYSNMANGTEAYSYHIIGEILRAREMDLGFLLCVVRCALCVVRCGLCVLRIYLHRYSYRTKQVTIRYV